MHAITVPGLVFATADVVLTLSVADGSTVVLVYCENVYLVLCYLTCLRSI